MSRFGFFGQPIYTVSKRILDIEIPYVDPPLPKIQLNFQFNAHTNGGTVKGVNGKTYYSGNIIELHINANTKCWLSLFSIDPKGVYGLFNNTKEPKEPIIFEHRATPLSITFSLDDTIGREVYYAVASQTKFSFKDQILPRLKEIKLGDAKGPIFPKYDLNLGDKFSSQIIYFDHR